MAKPPFLPIINTSPRARGFAGLISDSSLLDIETITIDKTAGGTANGLLFRAGTVAVVTRVSAKSGNRFGKPAVAADATGATTAKRLVAISFSHDGSDQRSEFYNRNPDTGAIVSPRPVNGVNTGRLWLFLNGAAPATTGVAKVAVADIPASSTFDKTKPYVNGAVKVAAADGTDAIPGWVFTGHIETDPATGYQIAEVECKRA